MSDAPDRRDGPRVSPEAGEPGDGKPGQGGAIPVVEGGAAGHDVVMLQGPTDDGRGVRALRARPGELALTELRPLEHGKPIGESEVVRLKARRGSPILWDVDVAFDGRRAGDGAAREPAAPARSGPARFNSRSYRDNWERIFGRRRRRGSDDAPN